jgi:hypothetical protein
MTLKNYFARMLALGYPSPSITLWCNDVGRLKGSTSYMGTCGHAGISGFVPKNSEHLIEHLFNHVTEGGKRFEEPKTGSWESAPARTPRKANRR